MLKQLFKYFSFFFFVFLVTSVRAQTYGDPSFYLVDSLDLEQISETEKDRIDSLLNVIDNTDPRKDTLIIVLLGTISLGSNYPNVTELYNLKSKEVIDKALKKKNLDSKSRTIINILDGKYLATKGFTFISKSEYDSALTYLKASLVIFNETKTERFIPTITNAVALCYNNLGHYLKAIEIYNEALLLAEKNNSVSDLASVYHNIASIHSEQKNYDKAIKYFDKAVEYANKSEDYYIVVFALSNKADLLLKMSNDTAQAKKLINQAFQIGEANDLESYLLNTIKISARISLAENKIEKSIADYVTLIDLSKKYDSKSNLCQALIGLSKVYLLKGEYNKVDENINEALAISVLIKDDVLLMQAYETLATSSQKQKKYKTAYENLKNSDSLKAIINDENNKKAILKNTFEYEYNQQKKIDSLQNDKKLSISLANEEVAEEKASKSRFQTIIAIGVTVLTIFFLYIIFTRLRIIRKQKMKLDIAYEQLEESKKHELAASNLKAIKSQMNPHFIFNSINSIQDLVLQQETLKSYDYLVVFSKMVRTILDFSEREFIPLEEEVNFLTTYLGLEKLRFQDDFEFNIDVKVKSESVKIPSLIIQPFVENAIKHGLLHKTGKKELNLSFTQTETEFICIVEDNGIGMEEANKIKSRQTGAHKSFSTDAIEKRLKLLEEQTNSKANYTMQTIKADNGLVLGTKVVVILPVK